MKYQGIEGMKIFEPIDIGSLHLKNRIGIGPYGAHPRDEETCFPNDKTVEYYEVLARTGVAFVMVGITEIRPPDKRIDFPEDPMISHMMPRIDCDETIPLWRKVTDMFHSHDCACGVQLGMFGHVSMHFFSPMSDQFKKYAYHTQGPCDTALTADLPDIPAFTKEYLQDIITFAGQAARRAKEAGFDCVEVHAAHSDVMLTACAMDPMFNSRKDEYGGSIEGRLRFPTEMIREMKKQTGGDFPVFFRINGDDLKGELGNTNEDICKYVIPELEKAGLDCFDISMGGNLYAPYGNLPNGYYPRAAWMHLPAAVKKVTKKPVIGVGRVTSVEMAEKIVREGMCDIMYFGRQAYVDPDIIHKFMQGKNTSKDVRQCIGCDTGCFPCTMNPEALSMVTDYPFPAGGPVEKPKKILVVGGGVGGMEFARHAAMRGHKVTLWEKKSKLGGVFGILATTPHLAEFQNAVDFLSGQMTETGVDVRVCYEATIERIKEFAPDVVVLASGALEKLPEHLEGQPMVMSLIEAMERKREFRSFYDWHKKVWFSGFTGCEFALDLCSEGAEVTMMGPGGDKTVAVEPWFTPHRKAYLRRKLTDANFIRKYEHTARADIKMLFETKFEGVDAEGIHYYHNGIHKVAPYDVVIVMSPRVKNDQMYEELEKIVPEVYKIGDCNKVAKAGDAILSGNVLAKKI